MCGRADLRKLGTIFRVCHGHVLPGRASQGSRIRERRLANYRQMNTFARIQQSVRLAEIVPHKSRIAGEQQRPGFPPALRRQASGTNFSIRGDAMSVSPISNASTSSLIDSVNQNIQKKLQQFQQEFQQLGTDLQAGNLSAAQKDLSALPGSQSSSTSTSSTQSSDPISQAFNQLAQDLQSGNISAAQQDYNTLKQDFQKTDPGHNNLRHHVHGFEGGNQPVSPWGQVPQTGTVSAAQTAYNSLMQDFQQIGSGSTLTPALQSETSNSSGVSFSA